MAVLLSFENVSFCEAAMCGRYVVGSRTPTDEFEYDPTTGLRVNYLIIYNLIQYTHSGHLESGVCACQL